MYLFNFSSAWASVAAVGLAGCGRIDFNEALYTDRCWAPGRCVAVMNLQPQLEGWLEATGLPVEVEDRRRWRQEVERLDGTFRYLGVHRLDRAEQEESLEFLLKNRSLVLQQFAPLEEELLRQAPVLLERNDSETLARVRVGIAPYLQQTNGSVGVVNGGERVVFLLGVDRLAYNRLERDQDETWVRSVVAHELVHVSHFATSSFATTHRGDPTMSRSLWVEGLAVWGSAHAGATPYGLADVFGEAYAEVCLSRGPNWASDYLDGWDDKDAAALWWEDDGQGERRYGVVTPGYCLAYLTIEEIVDKSSFDELLTWAPARAYAEAREGLSRVAEQAPR